MANERYIIPNATRVLLDFSEDGKILSIFIEKKDKSSQLKIVSLFDEDQDNILRFIEILNNEEQFLNEEIQGKKRLICKNFGPYEMTFV